ncbi:MAG: phosphate ABC transporter substrate-binding protein [Nitrospirae bacterium]|nr:phosphate ABC transporter substrate-binding protein [Nitrospirota bacterium]
MKTGVSRTPYEGLTKKIALGMIAALVMFTGSAFAEEKIRIAGAGGMISLGTELAKAFMAEHKNTVIEVNQKSIETRGGIMSAAEGKVDIGMASRPLKEEEKKLGITAIEIARVANVLGVNKSVPIVDISSENVCKIYSGKTVKWSEVGGPAEPILLLTRPEADATKEAVRKHIACFKDLKEPASAVVVPTHPEMNKILSGRPFTIGFTDTIATDDSAGAIVPLKLDGVAPTAENVRNGKYRMIKNMNLVVKGEPKGEAKAFIDFVKGPKGAKIIEANKAVAVK